MNEFSSALSFTIKKLHQLKKKKKIKATKYNWLMIQEDDLLEACAHKKK